MNWKWMMNKFTECLCEMKKKINEGEWMKQIKLNMKANEIKTN